MAHWARRGGQGQRQGVEQTHRVLKDTIVPLILTSWQHDARQVLESFVQRIDWSLAHVDGLSDIEKGGPVGLLSLKLLGWDQYLLHLV